MTNCEHCRARPIARGQAAWKAMRGITEDELKAEVERSFGAANLDKGLRLVWAWVDRLREAMKQTGSNHA